MSELITHLRAEAVRSVHEPLTQHFVAAMKEGAWPFVGNLFDGGAAFGGLPVKATPEAVARALLHAAVLIGGGPLLDEMGRVVTVRAKRPRYGSEGVTFGEAHVTVPLILAPHRAYAWVRTAPFLGDAVLRCEMALAADAEAQNPGAAFIFDRARAGAFTPRREGDLHTVPGPHYSAEVQAAARLPGDPERIGGPAPAAPPPPTSWGFLDEPEDEEGTALDAEQRAIRARIGITAADEAAARSFAAQENVR